MNTDRENLIQIVKEKARAIRINIIEMTGNAGSGHPGGSLSSADIIAALYFGNVLRVRPEEPDWPDRDLSLIHISSTCFVRMF